MKLIHIALAIALAACAVDSRTPQKNDATADSATDLQDAGTYELQPEAQPLPSPPKRDALAPDGSPGPDAGPDVSPEASTRDAGPDGVVIGVVACKATPDCAGQCEPFGLVPLCLVSPTAGTGYCYCGGCQPDAAAESSCVAHCDAEEKDAARAYCGPTASYPTPDRGMVSAAICYCGS